MAGENIKLSLDDIERAKQLADRLKRLREAARSLLYAKAEHAAGVTFRFDAAEQARSERQFRLVPDASDDARFEFPIPIPTLKNVVQEQIANLEQALRNMGVDPQ